MIAVIHITEAGLNGIRTYDLFGTGAVLTNKPFELTNHLGADHIVSLNIPVEGVVSFAAVIRVVTQRSSPLPPYKR